MSATSVRALVDTDAVDPTLPGHRGADGPASPADDLFAEYRSTGDRALRNRLIEMHEHLVVRHLHRFTGRGIHRDDLRQSALLALLKAVERFDPDREVAFATFASRTIDGELKRTLRDRSWSVRPPRRLQENYLEVRKAEDELIQSLGRSPTIAEIAGQTDLSTDLVLESREAAGARQAGSLDRPTLDGATTLHAMIGGVDPSFGRVDARVVVGDLLEALGPRERAIIELRFFSDMAQPEIADRLGLSQSYVSRLIRRVLETMRQGLDGSEDVVDESEQAPTRNR